MSSANLVLLIPLLGLTAERELSLRREESKLLHHKLSFGKLVTTRGLLPKVPPRARFYVVHLWAVECPPCVSELTWFKTIVERRKGDRRVGFVFITETQDQEELRGFLKSHRAEIPDVEYYQNGEPIRSELLNYTQPLTLLVDDRLVVRHAFLGSVVDTQRTTELATAITRLLQTTP